MVRFMISHSVLNLHTERRFDDTDTVGAVKEKLQMVVGTPPQFMTLEVQDKEGNRLMTLNGDGTPLSAFRLGEFSYLHVVDSDPNRTAASLNDVSGVEKYEISDEAYSQRRDTFRKFKEKFLVKKPDEAEAARQEAEKETQEEKEKAAAAAIKVGQRCELVVGAVPQRGSVAFVGDVLHAEGVWVGVALDEPAGKHSGTVKGKSYFKCAEKHGLLVRPTALSVGDYPERDPFDELDDSDQEKEKGEDEDEDVMAEL